jgi:NAD(P)-dependent dehydrogenase (short-subunit alcohol dehydrogenase family)
VANGTPYLELIEMPPITSAKDLFDLTGEVALITGASSGLGARFAHVLAAQGAKVILAARRLNRLEALVQEISAAGGAARALQFDVTKRDQLEASFHSAEAAFGPVTILVNSAGVVARMRFLETDAASWDNLQRINVDGVWFVGQEAARRMVKYGIEGAIINIASIFGFRVRDASSAYAISKAAVVQITNTMAVDLARHGIRVNAIAPGFIRTDLTSAYLGSDAGRAMLEQVPQGRHGETSDLDGTMMLLASRRASGFMTGSTIVVDGGHMWAFR